MHLFLSDPEITNFSVQVVFKIGDSTVPQHVHVNACIHVHVPSSVRSEHFAVQKLIVMFTVCCLCFVGLRSVCTVAV